MNRAFVQLANQARPAILQIRVNRIVDDKTKAESALHLSVPLGSKPESAKARES